jgi:hypothetical protein
MKNRSLRLEITVNSSEPQLLEGLDLWLQMGLIGESQVRFVAKHYLTCSLPEPVREVASISEGTPPRDFAPEAILPVRKTTVTPLRPNFISQTWQSFKDEISVRWFLFLGLFCVIIGSVGLAATQWQRFPDALQYGVLWAYTLIFWGVGLWLTRQENLQLTAQTLQTIAIVLIPVNFWAMDALWKNPWEWITVAIAASTLTGIYFLYRQSSQNILLFGNFLGLSYLHWGWKLPSYPAIAVYIGIIATAIILRFFPLEQTRTSPVKIGRGIVIYALSVLLIRAIFVVHLPIQQLGLAIGVCGWLFQKEKVRKREGERERGREGEGEKNADSWSLVTVNETIGAILLLIGWLVGVGESFPWQAMVVSLLALHFFAQRLRRDWLRKDLLVIFIIGVQAHFLIGRLIPLGFKQEALAISVQIAHSEAFPWTVYSLTLFPYLIFFVWLTGWLYRREKSQLAAFGEWLTLWLGIVLTAISLYNPTWRSLNLFLSTATLVYVVYHRTPLRVALLYFTHLVGLLAICSAIDWWFPSLSISAWASILLGLMLVEWGISTRTESQTIERVWYRSCWHMGFVLASASYPLFWERVETFFVTGVNQPIVLLWLLAPLTLTGVAMQTQKKRRRSAAQFSSYFLIFAQFLMLWQPSTRFIGLGVASGLMLVNSNYFRHQLAAALQIGFSLSFVVALLWGKLSGSAWFLFGAIAISTLWLLSIWLRQKHHFLASLYRKAADSWAAIICLFELTLLTFKSLSSYLDFPLPHWHYLVTPIVIGGAIFYRYRQQLSDRIIYWIIWAGQLTIYEGIVLLNGSKLTVATVNTILGLFSLFLTNWLFERQSHLTRFNSLKILPLLLVLLGVGWRWEEFNDYTGLLTLAAAITGLGISYRFPTKAIAYLSLMGISLGCYEIVIYQMLQATGGSPADGLTILAIVAAAIALFYRLLATFLQSRDINNFLNLSLNEIKITAHIHWALGSILKILSAAIALENEPRLSTVSIAISVILATYALIQGRDPETRRDRTFSDWWIYVGLVEFVATVVYARLLWEQLSILDPFRVIITCIIALLIYQIPWRNLGWESNPWHRFALIIPTVSILITIEEISYLSLFIAAAFYVRIAFRQKEIRWTYVSLGFIDWAIARFLVENNLTDILYYASIVGLSLLYIAQFDPTLSQPQQRSNRHILRISGSGIICLIALLFHQHTGGITPTIISLITIFFGLGLQIRAFLFIGTMTFILTGFYQLVVLSFEYSLAKWIIGLVVGIIFIVIAANFERRREEIIRVLQNWFEKLERWQ